MCIFLTLLAGMVWLSWLLLGLSISANCYASSPLCKHREDLRFGNKFAKEHAFPSNARNVQANFNTGFTCPTALSRAVFADTWCVRARASSTRPAACLVDDLFKQKFHRAVRSVGPGGVGGIRNKKQVRALHQGWTETSGSFLHS